MHRRALVARAGDDTAFALVEPILHNLFREIATSRLFKESYRCVAHAMEFPKKVIPNQWAHCCGLDSNGMAIELRYKPREDSSFNVGLDSKYFRVEGAVKREGFKA